ncbi:hypothetical protein PMAYCL1PPCAC_22426 [Pristionchus mayeri]|uniref:Uncharacterized protein n=1 Tax=Pristionchus mayeri TaxID=1317129 RepID=A0AAN5I6J0_9BILA|nr:hypothetical protein PMAYCL1PPCAC_22426 [Pristionchus mayeri]
MTTSSSNRRKAWSMKRVGWQLIRRSSVPRHPTAPRYAWIDISDARSGITTLLSPPVKSFSIINSTGAFYQCTKRRSVRSECTRFLKRPGN